MTILWAIAIQPLNLNSNPWIHDGTLRRTRSEAWKAMYKDATPIWRKTLNSRRRKNLIRAVKVTINKVTK
jgi:hypothetical protein